MNGRKMEVRVGKDLFIRSCYEGRFNGSLLIVLLSMNAIDPQARRLADPECN
jgi:hypothetical protein